MLIIPCNFCVYGPNTTSACGVWAGALGHWHKKLHWILIDKLNSIPMPYSTWISTAAMYLRIYRAVHLEWTLLHHCQLLHQQFSPCALYNYYKLWPAVFTHFHMFDICTSQHWEEKWAKFWAELCIYEIWIYEMLAVAHSLQEKKTLYIDSIKFCHLWAQRTFTLVSRLHFN